MSSLTVDMTNAKGKDDPLVHQPQIAIYGQAMRELLANQSTN
jgi:hypothetical protein